MRTPPVLRPHGLAALALVTAIGLFPRPAAASESLSYQWTLKGFVGRLASLVLPSQGHGELRTQPNEGGRITELEITSPQSKSGEYFLYGGETRADGSTSLAWSSYRWNGKENSKRSKVDEEGVVDIASGIHLIRDRQPAAPLNLRIWSDGKVYPVVVERQGSEQVKVPAGMFATNHYLVHGLHVEGERFWKGGLELWLTQDADATPVQIQVDRGFAHLQLQMLPQTTAGGTGRSTRR
jgi:hypothetical protein